MSWTALPPASQRHRASQRPQPRAIQPYRAIQPDGASRPGSLVKALVEVLPRMRGAFSLVLADRSQLVGVRDPNGFRPLCLGKLDEGWVLASESPALDITGAHFVREVEPGEVLVINADGCRSFRPWPAGTHAAHSCACSSSSTWRVPTAASTARNSTERRVRMGELLAEQAPVAADIVVGVPDSGMPAAEGFQPAQRHPLRSRPGEEPYIGRTFINPDPRPARPGRAAQAEPAEGGDRRQAASGGGRLDRAGYHDQGHGAMLREAGAREVHLRISSPPYRWPCFYGLDTGARSELVAADLEVGEICDYIGADSLAYLSLEALKKATGVPGAGFCDACLTGNYPVPVSLRLSKTVLEPPRRARTGAGPLKQCLEAPLTYAAAGVDIDAGERAVHLMRPSVASTARPEVIGGLGSFGGLFALPTGYREPVLVASTDGVGTKLAVAIAAGRLGTIGVDLVAMCVDDLVCQGAEPLFLWITSCGGTSTPTP